MKQRKQELREEIWSRLEESGDTLFPGPEGRIPNFKGREEATDRLTDTPHYQSAENVKINPDSPQKPVREEALSAGKTLYMAVPKLKQKDCFLRLDPNEITSSPSEASTIKGASRHGEPVHPSEMANIDLIVTGTVGVDEQGSRLGKGGGYSDLEYAILNFYDRIDSNVHITSTVHPTQEVEPGRIPTEPQDIRLNSYFTPNKAVNTAHGTHPPGSIDRNRLTEDQIESIPILEEILNLETDDS